MRGIWISWRLPVLMSKFFLSCERTSTSAFMLWNYISSIRREIVKLLITVRARCIFDYYESRRGESDSKFRIFEFTNWNFGFSSIQSYSFIGSWSRCIFIREASLNSVYSLRSDRVRRGCFIWFFVFILNNFEFTEPTPGCLWS
jgi:hypothetical protein